MQLSIDGFVGRLNGELDWMVWDWDQALKDYVGSITEPVDCIVLGRRLAEGFIPYWKKAAANPETADKYARFFATAPKIVFSKTLSHMEGEEVKIVKGELVQEITRLKNLPGKDIITYGGATLAAELIKNNLIDDLHLFVNPTVIGQGLSVFKEIRNKLDLKLVDSLRFKCGIVLLHYQPD